MQSQYDATIILDTRYYNSINECGNASLIRQMFNSDCLERIDVVEAPGAGRAHTSVKSPIAGLGVSNTIRAAVANWAKTLATELGPFGITVNNVLPGFTKTVRADSFRSRSYEI